MEITAQMQAELPVTHQEIIRERYLDEMGHMNVIWYHHLFHQATRDLFRQVGLVREYMETEQAGTFALEGHVRYLAEVRVGQHVTVRTRVIARSEKRCQLLHLMWNDDNQTLSATFERVFAHMDLKIRRMAEFPESIAAKIDALIAAHARLPWEATVCGVMGP